jgi:hypothetical protein
MVLWLASKGGIVYFTRTLRPQAPGTEFAANESKTNGGAATRFRSGS